MYLIKTVIRLSSRQDSVESRSTLQSTILDERTRRPSQPADDSQSVAVGRPSATTMTAPTGPIGSSTTTPQSCIVDERGRTLLKP